MTDVMNIYTATPRVMREWVVDAIESKVVPFIKGPPGCGKSEIVASIFDDFNLAMVDHRLSTSAPEDLSGLPDFQTLPNGERRAIFAPFDIFPLDTDPVPEGKDGWGLFLDEFNSAELMVQAACYKLILDRKVGQRNLHSRVAPVLAGNRLEDRAIVNKLSTAMQSRVVHIKLVVSYDEWLLDVALKQGYDERIMAYLAMNPKALMDFKPDHDDETFCCPRTWSFMNRMVKGKPVTDEKTGLYAGTITSGHAAAFTQFCKIYKDLVTIREILADPENAHVPMEAQRKWAIITHLINHVDDKNFGKITDYVSRYDLTFRVLFFRSIMVNHPKLREHPAYAKAMSDIQKYLNPQASSIIT